MFGKINVQNELDALAEEEQKIRNKYGRRFNQLYHSVVDGISNNTRIIDAAKLANAGLDVELKEVVNALEVINCEVE